MTPKDGPERHAYVSSSQQSRPEYSKWVNPEKHERCFPSVRFGIGNSLSKRPSFVFSAIRNANRAFKLEKLARCKMNFGAGGFEGMFLAFCQRVLEQPLPEQEHSQIVQTIEMFETITQTHPDDYQSLEILKEAYQKVGRHEDSARASRRLAEAYFNAGSYPQAMRECEMILSKEPSAPDILAMIGEIETRLQASAQMISDTEQNLSFGSDGALIDVRGAHIGKLSSLHDRG